MSLKLTTQAESPPVHVPQSTCTPTNTKLASHLLVLRSLSGSSNWPFWSSSY